MTQKDTIIYYPLKCGGKFVPFAYSFLGSVSAYSDCKDAVDFIKASYLTEKECQDMCDALNSLV